MKNKKGMGTLIVFIIGFTIVLISYFIMAGWILSPTEFVFKFEMDNNSREVFIKTMESQSILNESEYKEVNNNTSIFVPWKSEDVYVNKKAFELIECPENKLEEYYCFIRRK